MGNPAQNLLIRILVFLLHLTDPFILYIYIYIYIYNLPIFIREIYGSLYVIRVTTKYSVSTPIFISQENQLHVSAKMDSHHQPV
jgi:hypothetical protein